MSGLIWTQTVCHPDGIRDFFFFFKKLVFEKNQQTTKHEKISQYAAFNFFVLNILIYTVFSLISVPCCVENVILCMLGNFSCFCCHLLIFFKINLSKNSFRNTIRVLNCLDPDQERCFVSTYLGPNCLQRLSADGKKVTASKKRVNIFMFFFI